MPTIENDSENNIFLINDKEIKQLEFEKKELSENCEILDSKFKELHEKYIKSTIENTELKEKLKYQVENSNSLVLEIEKLRSDTTNRTLFIENKELLDKLEISEIEKKRIENKYKGVLFELEQELEDYKQKYFKVTSEKKHLNDDYYELTHEISNLSESEKKKDLELKKLRLELADMIAKKNLSYTELSNINELEIQRLETVNKELKLQINEAFQAKKNSQSCVQKFLSQSKKFGLNPETKQLLFEICEDYSQQIYERLESGIQKYKSKIKDYKSQVLQQTSANTILTTKIKELEVLNSQKKVITEDSPKKMISNLESFISQTPTFTSQIERYKLSLEKQKIAKRRAIAEKEQYKEDLANTILEMSELQQKLMKIQLEASDNDFFSLLVCQAVSLEQFLTEKNI